MSKGSRSVGLNDPGNALVDELIGLKFKKYGEKPSFTAIVTEGLQLLAEQKLGQMPIVEDGIEGIADFNRLRDKLRMWYKTEGKLT